MRLNSTKFSKGKFILSVLATSAVLVAGVETMRPFGADAAGPESMGGMMEKFVMGDGPDGHFREMAENFICGDARTQWRERALSLVNYVVDPAEEQKALFEDIRTKASENDKIIAEACATYKNSGEGFLAQMEKRRLVLETALKVMDNMQPAIKAFYTSLNEEQIGRLKSIAPPVIARQL